MQTKGKMNAESCCRFRGILKEFKVSTLGEEKWTLGKGILFLPDTTLIQNTGQEIKIQAWEDIAERLNEVERGSWITILSSYDPNMFRGILYDNFNITSFMVHSE